MYYRYYSVNKYEKGGTMVEDGENQDERALNQLNKLKEQGKLKRYVDVRGNGKKVFDTIVPNKKQKGMYKRYESLSQSSIGTLQNEYLDETDVLNWLKKTMPKREMTNKIIGESKTEDIEQVEIKKDTDIDYAKTIKEGNKYGDWSLMKFDPIKFNDDGSLSGGYIRLVNQDTLDKLEILNDLNLRGNKYFISYGGVQIIDKNPRTVIEKVLKLANKVIDESKTEDIEEKEINKGSNIDKEIKSLEIALKYSGANTRLRIEKEISSLKIAQKYETKNENALDKLKGNKEAKIVYDNLHDILALSDDEIISYKPKETYNDRLVDLALKIDKTMLTEAHAEWRTHIIRERNVKNLLYKLMNKNVDSTLKLLELVKTIPKYLHESIDIFQETYNRVLQGKINSDDGAIYLNENDYEVTNEIYDRLRLAEKRFQKNLKGLEVHDIITVKGKNGNKDFPANFRGFTNDGKLVVVYEGGKQMTINSDEYY